ncbi:MAG: molybdate ABC transporter substrate-binding protein [Nocardioidaceae bacterium]
MKKTLALVLAVLVLAAGCSSGSSGDAPSGQGTGSPKSTTLTVLAASSLTVPFESLAKTFEQSHPGVHVRFSFDSSATLAEQVNQGAPADVLATADTTTMKTVTDAGGTAAKPQLFASNTLVLVVPKSNPAHIKTFSDITRPGVSYVMCVVSAPCGALTHTLLAANHVTAKPKSLEVDVKSVLSKVQLSEADAGFVYASDAKTAAGTVDPVTIPKTGQYVNEYPIAPLKHAQDAALAKDWVSLVLSAQGQKVLQNAGFGKP